MLSFLAPVVTWIIVDRRPEPRYFMHSQAVTNRWELREGGGGQGGLGGLGLGGLEAVGQGLVARDLHQILWA